MKSNTSAISFLLVAALALFAATVTGRPTGAPACHFNLQAVTKGHGPPTDLPEVKISLSAQFYVPGKALKISVTGPTGWKGLLMYASAQGGAPAAGAPTAGAPGAGANPPTTGPAIPGGSAPTTGAAAPGAAGLRHLQLDAGAPGTPPPTAGGAPTAPATGGVATPGGTKNHVGKFINLPGGFKPQTQQACTTGQVTNEGLDALSGASTITHSDPTAKQDTTSFIWLAPTKSVGPITFSAVVNMGAGPVSKWMLVDVVVKPGKLVSGPSTGSSAGGNGTIAVTPPTPTAATDSSSSSTPTTGDSNLPPTDGSASTDGTSGDATGGDATATADGLAASGADSSRGSWLLPVFVAMLGVSLSKVLTLGIC